MIDSRPSLVARGRAREVVRERRIANGDLSRKPVVQKINEISRFCAYWLTDIYTKKGSKNQESVQHLGEMLDERRSPS